MAIIGLLLVLCDFGVTSATSKYIAEFRALNDNRVNNIFLTIAPVIIGLSTIVSILVIYFGAAVFNQYYQYMLYLIPFLFFAPLASILDGVYRGHKDFRMLSIISLVSGISSLILAIFLISKFGFLGAVISQNIIPFISFSLLFVFRRNLKWHFDRFLLSKVFRYSIVIGMISLMFFFYTKVDIVILKHFGYIEEIGYYEIINKIFQALVIPFVIIGTVLAPDMTRLYANKKFSELRKAFKRHFYWILGISVFVSLLIYQLFPILLQTFLEQYFTSATSYIFQVLIMTLPLKLVAAVINHGHTVPTGNAHFSMWTMIPAGILNVILDFIFINIYGFIGVVYATLICFTFANSSFMALYYFKLRRLTKNE
jgi:O-antigen/teichoic acid export membrane protein